VPLFERPGFASPAVAWQPLRVTAVTMESVVICGTHSIALPREINHHLLYP
jgi:hypothetical protein